MANHGKGKQGAGSSQGKQKAKGQGSPRKKDRARNRADVGKRRVPNGAHADGEGSTAGEHPAAGAPAYGGRASGASRARGEAACGRPAQGKSARAVGRGGKPAGATPSPCSVDRVCGGCENISVPYKKQLVEKQVAIERLFANLADERAFRLIRGMKDPFHYRNKVISPYAPGKKIEPAQPSAQSAKGKKKPPARHEILTGMYVAGTHELVPTDSCLIENEAAKKVTLAVRDIMREHGIAPYREDTGTGFMRHAVVRAARSTGEVLVTLVTNADEFPASKSFCRELVERCPEVTTVVQNVNERQTNVILGDKERVLFGPGFIFDELCGLSFRISSKSFYQVNAVQAEVLYECAIELARLDGTQTVIDAYCGTGTIGLAAAARGAARVIGVDSVPDAIRDAQQNARHNGVENAEFVAADATEFMEGLADKGLGEGEGELVVLMDPPRAGSTERFLAAAAALSPARIVYVSCNPQTQARDVEYLYDLGYRVVAVQPVDMFPHTAHIECIVCLEPDGPRVHELFPFDGDAAAGFDGASDANGSSRVAAATGKARS